MTGFPTTSTTGLAQPAEGTLTPAIKVTPFTAGRAPFEIVESSTLFSPTWDQTAFMGWNVEGAAGGTPVTGQPSLIMGLENDYWDGTHHNMEWYVEYNSPDQSSVVAFRPFFTGIIRDNNASHSAHTQLNIGDATGSLIIASVPTNIVTFTSTTASFQVPILLAAAGTANGQLTINAPSGAQARITWEDQGVPAWTLFQIDGDGHLYLHDDVNNHYHMDFTPGASDAAAVTDIRSSCKIWGNVGFYNTAPIAKPTVTGSKAANAALTSLMSALSTLGLVTDSTT